MVVKSHPKVFTIIVCSMYSLMNIINFPHIIHYNRFPLQFSIVIETQCLDCNGFLMPPACKQIATHIANSVFQIKKLLINYGHYHIFCPGVIMTIPENQSVWSFFFRFSLGDLFKLNWFITTLHLWRKVNFHSG